MQWFKETIISRSIMVFLAIITLMGTRVHADFIFSEPTPLPAPFNSNHNAFGASMTADGLELYYSNYETIWVATRATAADDWSSATHIRLFGGRNPIISCNGLELYFAGELPTHIYRVQRKTLDDTWGPAENMAILNSTVWNSVDCLSADGLVLYYNQHMATRATKDSDWVPSETSGLEGSQWGTAIAPSGLHLVVATRNLPGNMGKEDFSMATRPTIDAEWGDPVNLGTPMSSDTYDRSPWIAYDGSAIFFDSARAGGLGQMDLWHASISPVLDLNGDDKVDTIDVNEMLSILGSTYDSHYDIGPTPFGDGLVDDKDLHVLKEYLHLIVTDPYPGNKANNIPADVVLSWESTASAQTYDVYLSTNYDDVRNADTTHPSYMGLQDVNHFDPGQLDLGRIYYWRVDEVNATRDSTVFMGDIWSFTTESFSYPLKNVTATASNSYLGGPEKTIDGSGLNESDQHSTNPADMWVANTSDGCWIQYEFNTVYKLYELWIWNSNQTSEPFVGFGVKDAIIETSIDGIAWTQVADVTAFAQASGSPTYNANTFVGLTGIAAKYVRITPQSSYGLTDQSGLSEVRFYYIQNRAQNLLPVDGTTTEGVEVMLSWRAGREAAVHEVYLGSDPANLDLVGITENPSFLAEGLDDGQTYYWQVVEVNETETPSTYASDIQSFVTPTDPAGTDVTVDYSESTSTLLTNVTATASGSLGGAPESTVDGSGLNDLDQHSTNAADMWLTLRPNWIQYEFDTVYTLHEMWVWNSNQAIERFIGFGIKDAVVETSLDGTTWTLVPDVPPFARATGQPTYTANTVVDLTGIAAKYVRITPVSTYGSGNSGLSEVRFYYFPTEGQ